MSVSRLMMVVPVLAGLVVTGTAVARMMPAESVRDSVYQTCAHNGVHFNKQGHANCGLHKGWSQDPATEPDQPATEPGTGDTGDTTVTESTSGHGKGHAKHEHATHAAGTNHGHGAKSHGATAHGKGHGKKHG